MRRRVLVVDDERWARAKLVRLLADDPRFELAGEADGGAAALAWLERSDVDVVVLDIEMPGMDGFEVLRALGDSRDFVTVFATAHDDRALAAFAVDAVDYLLKPYDRARLARALDKAWALLQGASAAAPARRTPRLVLRTAEGWVQPPWSDILRLSADDKHVLVRTRACSHRVRDSLAALAGRLDPERFVRVHRTEVVNLDALVRLEPLGHGDALLTLVDGSTVVASRTYRRELVRRMGGR